MNEYSTKEREILLKLARNSIQYALDHQEMMEIDLEDYPEHLRQLRATFVTLNLNKQLRGCIGTLEAHQPLVADIVHNAFAAAFADPRFQPITDDEFDHLQFHISILSKPEPITVASRTDLLQQLRPNIDGLILNDGIYRATFLPAVWESLPDANDFLNHLLSKAGLPEDYWSKTIQFERYTAESIL